MRFFRNGYIIVSNKQTNRKSHRLSTVVGEESSSPTSVSLFFHPYIGNKTGKPVYASISAPVVDSVSGAFI